MERCCSPCDRLELYRLEGSWEDTCQDELGFVPAAEVCDFWQQPYVEVDYVDIIQ